MNTLLFDPADVLFFKDGRPMSGSLAGNGAAWPLPTVTNAALHAALHRAGLTGVHPHVPGRSSQKRDYSEENRQKNGRLFGSLQTAGPFPVCTNGKAPTWFFPRPLDAGIPDATTPSLLPLATGLDHSHSSLAKPLHFAVASTRPVTKDQPKPWWSADAWIAYLGATPRDADTGRILFKSDAEFANTESTFGIGIDPATNTQDGERFYSAHYLRLREGWRLGCFAEAPDKDFRGENGNSDLVKAVFPNSGTQTPVIVGGQQRVCTVIRQSGGTSPLPLPIGIKTGFKAASGKHLVKWVLLTPAIFPKIGDHPGGWLPSWVDTAGKVQLLDGPGKNAAKRRKVPEGKPIAATLVASITGKPIPVTGYALPNEFDPDRQDGGPKSTHLSVPAGSVYYFECDDEPAAKALAAALNWHGDGDATRICNRRSTLMGEKGFGLGVCGTWQFHDGKRPE
ncbi:MAG: type III-B CRISPR module-associated protein Cmr3 [Prosthecobacter sp.]|uniref:type III-B CRISPR module-associated Cmr3 family protein n=1 Tax=Prosthecobacter sp. TaxID=1965333 RepID=UPI0025FD161E|nr:type III-B CRISPR module-associated Cmr3 family protein [Prosthecobacter sp.]MCF7786761.1 type III-B CRISPR module-associated protein Cmr3 [Prosthecobacter sp.]